MTRDETLELLTDAICNFGAAGGEVTPGHPAHWIAGIIETHCIKTGEVFPTVEDWVANYSSDGCP